MFTYKWQCGRETKSQSFVRKLLPFNIDEAPALDIFCFAIFFYSKRPSMRKVNNRYTGENGIVGTGGGCAGGERVGAGEGYTARNTVCLKNNGPFVVA